MTATVTGAGADGRHWALITSGDRPALCCEHGHPDPAEAGRHAWKLTRALARTDRVNGVTGG